jgi:hypothetical protein
VIIRIERSGGVTGIPLRGEIDTRKLPAAESEALQKQVEALNFFDLPEKIGGEAKGADRFQYLLSVEEAGRSHSVSVGETGGPPELHNLIQRLNLLARTQR